MSVKGLRTGLAAAMGIAVLVAGLLVGATIARADSAAGTGQTAADDPADDRGTVHRGFCGGLDEVATELGIDLNQLRQELRDGATLGELANEAGIDLSAVLENAKQRLRDVVDEKVAEGHLTQEQGDAIKESIDSFGLGDMSTDGFRRGPRNGHGLMFLGRHRDLLQGLDPDIDLSELRAELDSGLSLKDALTELGVDVDSLVDSARQSALQRIDQMVADGTITDERAAGLKQMIENFDFGDDFPLERGFGSHSFDGPGRHGPNGHRPGDQETGDSNAEGVVLHV